MSIYCKRAGHVGAVAFMGVGAFVGMAVGVGTIALGLCISPLPLVGEYIVTGECNHTRNGVNLLLNMGNIISNHFSDQKHYREHHDFFY